ncbi:MAG: glycosyltransferase family 4 protein [Candidatus Eisenbacteria bacterium]
MTAGRILFLPWDEAHNASARCRIFDLAAWLGRRGWETTVWAPVGGSLGARLGTPGAFRGPRRALYRSWQLANRRRQIGHARDFDVVVLQRELYPFGKPWLEETLRAAARAMVFDLDDALHLRPVHFRAATHRWHDFAKAEQIARTADAVVVSSTTLEEWATPLASRVVLVPTAVDTERFRPLASAGDTRQSPAPGESAKQPLAPAADVSRPPARGDDLRTAFASADSKRPLVLGWTGTAGNLAHLETIRPALDAVAQQVPCVLRVIGERAFAGRPGGIRTEFVPWDLEREPAEVARFDIGLMPLADSEYARAKAGYKALVYMACAVPPVLSPVGTNREIVQDGVDGLFAETTEAWRDGILRLAHDRELRARLGRAGRDRVVSERSVEALFPRWEALLNELIRGTR